MGVTKSLYPYGVTNSLYSYIVLVLVMLGLVLVGWSVWCEFVIVCCVLVGKIVCCDVPGYLRGCLYVMAI